MSFTYKAETPRTLIEVEVPTSLSIRPNNVKLRVTKKQHGEPDRPRYYSAEESIEVEVPIDDMRELVTHLERIL